MVTKAEFALTYSHLVILIKGSLIITQKTLSALNYNACKK